MSGIKSRHARGADGRRKRHRNRFGGLALLRKLLHRPLERLREHPVPHRVLAPCLCPGVVPLRGIRRKAEVSACAVDKPRELLYLLDVDAVPRVVALVVEVPPVPRMLLREVLRKRRKRGDRHHGGEVSGEVLPERIRADAAVGEPRQVQAAEVDARLLLQAADGKHELAYRGLHGRRMAGHPPEERRRSLGRGKRQQVARVLLLERGGRYALEDRLLAELPLDVAQLAVAGDVDDHRQRARPHRLRREEHRLERVFLVAALVRLQRILRHVRLRLRRHDNRARRRLSLVTRRGESRRRQYTR